MKPRYLFDEHVPSAISKQLRRLNPQIEALVVGSPAAPAKGTLDPELLIWLEKHNYILVTENRRTMPVHIREHYATGGRITGILWIRPSATIADIIEDLQLRWAVTTQEEYQDYMAYIPE